LKGLCLLFFPNVPGATLIQGATLISESRVREHLCTFCCIIMSPTTQIQIKGQRRGKAQRQTKPTFGGHNERMAEICASMLLCCLVGHSTKYSRGYDISHYVGPRDQGTPFTQWTSMSKYYRTL
jgi:hypothetical protein